jgi:hypothetical protein
LATTCELHRCSIVAENKHNDLFHQKFCHWRDGKYWAPFTCSCWRRSKCLHQASSILIGGTKKARVRKQFSSCPSHPTYFAMGANAIHTGFLSIILNRELSSKPRPFLSIVQYQKDRPECINGCDRMVRRLLTSQPLSKQTYLSLDLCTVYLYD